MCVQKDKFLPQECGIPKFQSWKGSSNYIPHCIVDQTCNMASHTWLTLTSDTTCFLFWLWGLLISTNPQINTICTYAWPEQTPKCALAWWQLWNFIVRQVKFNSFLLPNEQPQSIFWYLVKPFNWGLSKNSIFQV